ncbi:prolyl oligopeptidase family serine peptidase [Streptomyces scopuliridis]|uniref:Prolyl oligopeptidase family serine peptidase n=1 Tax=Streptomyces scopuliridis TaxID=452529 RepID=A0ACD4ZGE6_9ACTN|nr:LpqB family beta-propeller domain-containing protein [Streptomyces scopuliridis]WSB96877.1 prolyl oligopeptidase family serine peptidase [Streptomyces scopuliridis]WSC09419.1 prolyl oligopeptidase family serine peptidase [Streptomyces scopuliridis]
MLSMGAYGTWPSPIDAALAASHDGRPEYVGVLGDEVWWTEPRPAEAGRRALVRRRADGREESPLPAPWNVRSRVIEYGGVPWAGAARPDGGPLVVFVHFPDQRLYAYEPDGGGEPRPLTPVSATGGGLRWADPRLLLDRGEVWCVLEEFTGEAPTDVRRVIAAVPLDGSAAEDRTAVRELSDDRHRFVTGPRLSPDGRRAAWIAWDHPRMPWDGTEVILGEVPESGPFTGVRAVAGGTDESVAQVDWAPDGSLLLVSDAGGWWEIQRIRPEALGRKGAAGVIPSTSLCPGRGEEFGGPLWKIGLQWFHPMENGLIAVIHGKGSTALGVLDPVTGEVVDAAGPWTEWAATLAVQGDRVIGVAASPRSAYEIVELDTGTGHARVIGAAHQDPVDPAYYPEPRIRTFTGPDNREIHAHIYPPHSPDHSAPHEELPPYVVWAHGGPTGHAPLVLDLEIAYFTSRGIGVAEVNYGGSTGYGRAYRDRLREQWGVVDVEDCAAVASALAAEGTADPARLAVRGGSAGGWTTAVSLTSTDVYACGTISYPILDLLGWATDETHDFESQYLESLVGPLAEVPGRYRDRSPVHHADRVSAPFLLLQGLDDVICPPAQCERFLERMAGRGVPHAYLAFEGEGHGFRRADTMVSALEAELSLYAQTFGIDRTDIPRLEFRR